MRIFITGMAGFLGSHLVDAMVEEGHEVVGCDNLIGGYRDNVPDGAEFYEEDCNNFDKMKELLKGVDIVYHTACTAYEGLSVFSPKLVAENTYLNTVSMASAAIANNVKRFVTCSSMARYGTQEVVPFTEDTLVVTVQYDLPYISKWLNRRMLLPEWNLDEVIEQIVNCVLDSDKVKLTEVYNCTCKK